MKKYVAVKTPYVMEFATPEEAKQYCADHPDYGYQEYREYRYRNLGYRSSPAFLRMTGSDIFAAIKSEPTITYFLRYSGILTVHEIKLDYPDVGNRATLTITGWKNAKYEVGFKEEMLDPSKMCSKSFDILDVEPDDFEDASLPANVV